MKLNKLFLVSILLLAILALGSVNASEDIGDDLITDDSMEEVNAPDEILGETDSPDEILDENELSLSDFKSELESDKTEINLTNDYKYNPENDENVTVIHTKSSNSFVLEGNGHTIDGAGADIRLFIESSDVIIKNLVFKNFHKEGEDAGYSFIYCYQSGRIENCTFENFTNNGSSPQRSALLAMSHSNFIVQGSTFNNNYERLFYIDASDIQINNSNFSNNNFTWLIHDDNNDYLNTNVQINNCNFTDNVARDTFISLGANASQINNCSFVNNTGGGFGYITYQSGNNSIMYNCVFENNTAVHSEREDVPIARFGDLFGQKLAENISVNKVTFLNNKGIPIEWDGYGNVTECEFIGNNGTINVDQGTVYRDNGIYDFLVEVYNDTVIGEPEGYYSQDALVYIEYYGAKEGNIVLILDGIESYNKEVTDFLDIDLNELSYVKAGNVSVLIKFIGDEELVLYDDYAFIDYYLGIEYYSLNLWVSPHGELKLNIALPNDATGTLVLNDGIGNHTIEYTDGEATYIINGSIYEEIGEYDIRLSLINDPIYPDKTVSDKIRVLPLIDMPRVVAKGENDTIIYDFPDGNEVNLKIYHYDDLEYVKGDLLLEANVTGIGSLPLPALDAGGYAFLVELDDHTFTRASLVCIENSEKINSSIESDIIKLGEDVIINVNTSLEEFLLYVFVDCNSPPSDIDYRPIRVNGSNYTHRISDLAIGEHKIKIAVRDSTAYEPSYSNSYMVTVQQNAANLLQELIDNASPGDVIDLGNETYDGVSGVNITKNLTITGGTIIGSESAGSIFNIVPLSDGGPGEVNITNVNFKLNNGNTIVKAVAQNASDNTAIDVAAINIKENNIELASDDVVAESIIVLTLESERPILSPTNDIVISANTIAAGVDPFKFDVTSIGTGGDINVGPQNLNPERKATQIIYEDMNTTAVSPLDPNTGEWFKWRLVDGDGKPIANAPMKIGFNGVIYDEKNGMVTDKNGYAKLQINLGYKGDYTFAVSFLGNDEYNASFVVAKIKVATQTGSLTVPNRAYAASAKTKALTATLKTKSGKVIANKKISFTVNGKTYTVKTNAKGVATVNVSLNKKGTYNFVAKFAGDSTYTAITKKATLTIK